MTPQIELDFSNTNADGLVYTRTSRASSPVEVGMDVLGVDGDGNTCTMRVLEIKGQTVYLKADWQTWRDGVSPVGIASTGDESGAVMFESDDPEDAARWLRDFSSDGEG